MDIGRTWTQHEARDALPELRDALAALRKAVQRRDAAAREAEELRQRWGPALVEDSCPGHAVYLDAARAVQAAQRDFLAATTAFFEQGVQLDVLGGGIDFLSRAGATSAWLCAGPDDADVAHWHPVGTTCDERRPIPRHVA